MTAPRDDPLVPVVEQLERELSKTEASERRLNRELESCKQELHERDAQMEDVCSSWERSVLQMQQSRDEDVSRVTERLEFVEQVEVPQLMRKIEESETDSLRAQARAERFQAELENCRRQAKQLRADDERKLQIAKRETQSQMTNNEMKLKELERRRNVEVQQIMEECNAQLRAMRADFELERDQMRRNVGDALKGAAVAAAMNTISGNISGNISGMTDRETKYSVEGGALKGDESEFHAPPNVTSGVASMRVSEDGDGEHRPGIHALNTEDNDGEKPLEKSPEETRAANVDTSVGSDHVIAVAAHASPSVVERSYESWERDNEEDTSTTGIDAKEEDSNVHVFPPVGKSRFAFWHKHQEPTPRAAPPPLPSGQTVTTPAQGGRLTRIPSALVPPPPAR